MNQEETPLVEALAMHKKHSQFSFHVPGHKNGTNSHPQYQIFKDILSIDQTEVGELDDYHHATGCIQMAQLLLSELYQSRKSYFLINGSTVGNLSAIFSVCKENDTVLVQRDCHKSVLHAIKIRGLIPVFINTNFDANLGISLGVNEEAVCEAIQAFPEAKALIITSPNYYGVWTSLKNIIRVAHSNNVTVICDEAHGAHLLLNSPFPTSALSEGCDIVIQSAHKTLPAMTMGSYLHINETFKYQDQLEYYLTAFQSSSPSYPIMASLDMSRKFLYEMKGKKVEEIIKAIEKTKNVIRESDYVDLVEISDEYFQDPLKILITSQKGRSGYDLQQHLEKQGVYVELANEQFVLLIHPLTYTPYTEEQLLKLKESFVHEKGNTRTKSEENYIVENSYEQLPYSYQKLETFPIQTVSLKDSYGMINKDAIIPYPPGIPYIFEGEVIKQEKLLQVLQWIEKGASIQGGDLIMQGKVRVYDTREK